jgi:hypothetical protein
MDWLTTTLQRLTSHFCEVIVRPPAATRDFHALRSRAVNIPEDLNYFYSKCDGISVGLRDDVVGHIYPLSTSLSIMPIADDGEVERRFLPVRCDGCGNYDCVVLGDGIGEASVVFWDHEVYEGPAYLLGGSFSGYFQMWADRLTKCYLPDGQEDRRFVAPALDRWPWVGTAELEHPWPFDEQWMKSNDFAALALLNDPTARHWLVRQGM